MTRNTNVPSKDWMDLPRYSAEYEKGVKSFLDFSYTYGDPQREEIQCPCDKCCNVRWTRRDVVYNHLIGRGFVDGYKRWINHREWEIDLNGDNHIDNSNDDIDGLLINQFRHTSKKPHRVPVKVLRYFSLVPRLKRLFICSKIADSLRWHDEERYKDGKLRHPADGQAWKHFDSLYLDFALDSRNLRLDLSTDGFNPFRSISISHSTWPFMMKVYNFPSWMCMKPEYSMLSLLIAGPHSPGNDIGVHLHPLIDELNFLWQTGVETYDASRNQTFQMRAILLWTISDFPAHVMLSGWSTKGKLDCSCCNYGTNSFYLKHSRKTCYMDHHSKFFIPKEGQKWVMHGLRDAWRGFKREVKQRYFDKRLTIEKMLEKCPAGVPAVHLRQLIEYWKLPEVEALSEVNSQNRKKQKWRHRMRPINFGRVRVALCRTKENNEEPLKAEMFVATRTKTGKEVQADTQIAISELENHQNAGKTPDDAFMAVFGKEKPGRVRGYGRSVTRTSLQKDEEINDLKQKYSNEVTSMKEEIISEKRQEMRQFLVNWCKTILD
ncbi:hypothetical protein P3S67_007900 [Capsicum chacoense]